MSETREEYWMEEARKYESWFNRANYMRTQQEADNVALRELCGDMLLYIAHPYVCVKPSVLVERARELGIEVDG